MEHTERCCEHNRCLNHSPEWEVVGEPKLHLMGLKLNPLERILNFFRWLFGGPLLIPILHDWGFDTKSCCGRSLLWCVNLKKSCCKKCGRKDEDKTVGYFLYCPCCGYKRSTAFVPNNISIFQFRYINSDNLNKLMESKGLGIKATDDVFLFRHIFYSIVVLPPLLYLVLRFTLMLLK